MKFTIDDYTIVDEDDICKYIFEIKIDKDEHKPEKKLKVHAVIYIPEIMESLGWPNAALTQKAWFNGKKNENPWDHDPVFDNWFTIAWALGFVRVKTDYDKKKNVWKNEVGIKSLRNEIVKMVKNGVVKLPAVSGIKTSFGTFEKFPLQTVKRQHDEEKSDTNKSGIVNETVPLFDKYYYQNFVYEEGGELDDFYAAIANCTFRFVAKGTLELNKKEVGGYKATIEQIGVYIRDGFDFMGSQWLGCWSLKQKSVKSYSSGSDYRLVDNKSYRNYQKETNMGESFYRFTEIKVLDAADGFEKFTFNLNL